MSSVPIRATSRWSGSLKASTAEVAIPSAIATSGWPSMQTLPSRQTTTAATSVVIP